MPQRFCLPVEQQVPVGMNGKERIDLKREQIELLLFGWQNRPHEFIAAQALLYF